MNSFQVYYQENSKNYGLERLSYDLHRSHQEENQEKSKQSKVKQSEIQILQRISSFTTSDFHFQWSLLVFMANIYNLFTVPYFLGIADFPFSFWLGLELFFEFVLLSDLLGRLLYRDHIKAKNMWFFYEEETTFNYMFLILSSIPYSCLMILSLSDLTIIQIAIARTAKLLRGFQIFTFYNNLELVRKEKYNSLIESSKVILVIASSLHYLACIWILVARIESMWTQDYWSLVWLKADSPKWKLYADALFWSAESLTGIILEKSLPYSTVEIGFCIIVMFIGALAFAAIFGRLTARLESVSSQNEASRKMLAMAVIWAKQRNLSEDLVLKLKTYYKIAMEKFSNQLNYRFIDELPLSLKTEVCLFMYKDLIPKVKLFEMGDPGFMLGILRHMKPRLYMMGDYIIRQGDYPTEFYIVRVGMVEVLAADNDTQIALLDEGSYFGEIGVLFNEYRSVSVRAYNACIICYISKEEFLQVIKPFPDHRRLLNKVAIQRLKSVNVSDIDVNFDLMEDSSSSNDSDDSDDLEQPKFFTEREHMKKSWLQRFVTVPRSNAPSDRFVIDPLSGFYYMWAVLISGSFLYYIFYVPFAICFENSGGLGFEIINYLCYAVYCFDVLVSMWTAIMTEFGTYSHSHEEIKSEYLRYFALCDTISIVPADYICSFFQSPSYIGAYFRLFRLLKYKRVKHICKIIAKSFSSSKIAKIRLALLFLILIYLSHLFACLFFYIVKFQHFYLSKYPPQSSDYISTYDLAYGKNITLLNQSLSSQYVQMFYSGTSIISTAAYGDLYPVATLEKLFSIIWIIIARLFVAFLFAEATTFIGSQNRTYIRHLNKVALIRSWTSHTQIPKELLIRILNYYDLLWRRLKGCNDEEVLSRLPEALHTDICHFLFKGLTTSGLFPESESGALLNIVRRCKIEVYCTGETIISEGELGLEMYFIMEGEVQVITSIGVILNRLTKGHFFGELAMIKPVPDVRIANIIAESDVTLAVLPLEEYRQVSEWFPDFAEKVTQKAAEREVMNRRTISIENMQALKDYQKFAAMNEEGISVTDISKISEFPDFEDAKNLVPIKIGVKYREILSNRAKNIWYIIAWIWNMMFVPYKVAFGVQYQAYGIIFEVLTILIYFFMALLYFSTALMQSPLTNKQLSLFNAIHHLFLCFPFLLMGDYLNFSRTTVAIFGILRISNLYMIVRLFNALKENINWFITACIVEIFAVYLIVTHIFACYFIFIGKEFDLGHSWVASLGDPSDSKLYLYSFYWATGAFSHSAIGDISCVNAGEKLFNSFTFLITCFIYSLLFGSVASLVSGFASQLKTNLQESYLYVKDFVKKKKVEKIFSGLVDDYYNYIWHENKGIMEDKILNELPHSIKVSVLMFKYSKCIVASQVFKDTEGVVNYSIVQSILRLMVIQCYLIGDSIIKVGDKNFDMYILLEGEVDVLNLQGKKVLATLKEGAHFGEANIILKNEMRTATIMATKISKIGILSKANLELLFEAYPQWYEMLDNIVKSRMQQTFNTSIAEDVSKRVQSISHKLQSSPSSYNKYTKRSEKLLAPKLAELLAQTSSGKWLTLNFVHLILIIYSSLAIPFQIAYGVQAGLGVLFMESFVLVESSVFFLLNFRDNCKQSKILSMNYYKCMVFQYKHNLIEDLVALSPFNLIFVLSNQSTIGYSIILRLVRLLSMFRINSLLEKIEAYNRNLVRYTKFFRVTLIAILLLHWSSCIWTYLADIGSEAVWASNFGLQQSGIGVLYMKSIYYVANMISGTGYSNTYPADDTERGFSIFLSILGFTLYAASFGLMASVSQFKISKQQEMINNIRAPFSVINKAEIPQTLTNRIQQYYAFTTGLTQTIGQINFKTLYNHLPPNIVGTIIYECNKSMLKKLPFLAQANSPELIERISLCLIPQIYLPGDYIIYKNDIGEEMFFIMLGGVDILSPDNQKVLKTLRKGKFFGEVALLTDSRRMCSVVSNGLSLIYALNKRDFLALSEDFPELVHLIEEEAIKRSIENKTIKNKEQAEEERANENDELVNTFNLYSSLASPFMKGSPKVLSFISGIKNYDTKIMQGYSLNEKTKLHKRRAYKGSDTERRYSQESIGKEIVQLRLSRIMK